MPEPGHRYQGVALEHWLSFASQSHVYFAEPSPKSPISAPWIDSIGEGRQIAVRRKITPGAEKQQSLCKIKKPEIRPRNALWYSYSPENVFTCPDC